MEDRAGEAVTPYNIACIYHEQGKLEPALEQIEQATKIPKELSSKNSFKILRNSLFAAVQEKYQFRVDLLKHLHQRLSQKSYSK